MILYQETELDEHRYMHDAVYHANRELVRGLVEVGVLVPVEPCEHGNYARHINEDEEISEGGSQVYFEYCDGKP